MVDDGRWDSQGMQEIKRVEEALDKLEPSMQFPIGDIFTRAKSYEESPEFLTCVCSVYFLSRIFVESHKMMINNSAAQSSGAGPRFRANAILRIVAESLQFIRLLEQLLDNGQDITKLWYVTGYTAFVVARVVLVRSRTLFVHPKHTQADLFSVFT